VAHAAVVRGLPDDCEHDVLCAHTSGEIALDRDGHPWRGRRWGGSGGEDVLDLRKSRCRNARAPKAHEVDVWLSPHTIVMPGWVSPCSGPITWTIPGSPSPWGNRFTPNSAAVSRRAPRACLRGDRVLARGRAQSWVAPLWSGGRDLLRSGRLTRPARQFAQALRMPVARSPHVQGEGRCRARSGSSGTVAGRTTWAFPSSTFSASVSGMAPTSGRPRRSRRLKGASR